MRGGEPPAAALRPLPRPQGHPHARVRAHVPVLGPRQRVRGTRRRGPSVPRPFFLNGGLSASVPVLSRPVPTSHHTGRNRRPAPPLTVEGASRISRPQNCSSNLPKPSTSRAPPGAGPLGDDLRRHQRPGVLRRALHVARHPAAPPQWQRRCGASTSAGGPAVLAEKAACCLHRRLHRHRYFGSRGDYGKLDPPPREGADWLQKYDPEARLPPPPRAPAASLFPRRGFRDAAWLAPLSRRPRRRSTSWTAFTAAPGRPPRSPCGASPRSRLKTSPQPRQVRRVASPPVPISWRQPPLQPTIDEQPDRFGRAASVPPLQLSPHSAGAEKSEPWGREHALPRPRRQPHRRTAGPRLARFRGARRPAPRPRASGLLLLRSRLLRSA